MNLCDRLSATHTIVQKCDATVLGDAFSEPVAPDLPLLGEDPTKRIGLALWVAPSILFIMGIS